MRFSRRLSTPGAPKRRSEASGFGIYSLGMCIEPILTIFVVYLPCLLVPYDVVSSCNFDKAIVVLLLELLVLRLRFVRILLELI